ncbi:MAG TPA: HAD family phosphatase [Acidobacteriaceae bacterium]|jgi:putative hydrolase of the HAD superfamily|nr:HAD family phosphatase [Acidobacteriaceae bacterium]
MSGISTILWDVGGVLLTNGWDQQQRNGVLQHFALNPADFERRHAEVAEAWEKDEIGVDQYLGHTVFFEARPFTQTQFLEAMRAESQLLPDSAIGILRQIAASHDYVLATVNNESRAMNEFRLTQFGLIDLFDAFFSSCYLGLRKPDRKIYQVALDVLQRDPEDCIFIDDRPENVAAAVSLGIHGIRYAGSGKLIGELDRLGVRQPNRLRSLRLSEA